MLKIIYTRVTYEFCFRKRITLFHSCIFQPPGYMRIVSITGRRRQWLSLKLPKVAAQKYLYSDWALSRQFLFDMISLIFAIRHLKKNLKQSSFHVFGLAIGLLAFIFILLYVMDEWSYDRHNKNYKNIFRIESSLRLKIEHLDYAIATPAICADVS